MQISILKSKINKVRVTHCHKEKDDCCEIDGVLLDAANISKFEQLQIDNSTNGRVIITHAIRGKDNSGVISLNGMAANNCGVGDILTISSYASLDIRHLKNHNQKVCHVDEGNSLVKST